MWVAKFKLWHKSVILEASKKYKVKISAYYMTSFFEKGKQYACRAVVVEGKDAKQAIREIMRDKRLKIIFVKGNQLFYAIPVIASFHLSMLSKTVFPLKPIVVKDGFDYCTLASTHKKHLLEIIKKINSTGKARIELISLREETPNFFAPSALSALTDLQRQAITSAYENEYYKYPRKTDLIHLAHKLGVPYTTLVERLRKAEEKLMNIVLGELA